MCASFEDACLGSVPCCSCRQIEWCIACLVMLLISCCRHPCRTQHTSNLIPSSPSFSNAWSVMTHPHLRSYNHSSPCLVYTCMASITSGWHHCLSGAIALRGVCGLQAQKGVRHAAGKPVPLSLTPQIYLQRLSALAALQAAWSPLCALGAPDPTGSLARVHCVACFTAPVSISKCNGLRTVSMHRH